MTYCSAPWTTVNIKTDGRYSYCCVSWDLLGNHANDNNLVQGRQNIINGEILDVCKKACFNVESLYQSQRQLTNNLFPIKHSTDIKLNPLDIEYIDLRIGNICNYMCLMCNESQSHLWGKFKGIDEPHIHWGDRHREIIEFISSCKNLKRICLSGGEPFYNKSQLFEIMDSLSFDITLKFITNVSICDDEIINRMNKFKKGILNCSIDGVEHWIETQRYKSNWNTIEKNIIKFSEKLHKGWRINLVPTFSVLNVTGLPNFINWYYNVLSNVRKTHFAYSILYQPHYLTLYSLSQAVRNNIVSQVKDFNFELTDTINDLLLSVSKVESPKNKDIAELEKFLKNIKNKTNLDVATIIPEIGDLFK
jgi:hypothetical protein